jgi:hypothetical protein
MKKTKDKLEAKLYGLQEKFRKRNNLRRKASLTKRMSGIITQLMDLDKLAGE